MSTIKVYKLTMNGGATLYDHNGQNILDTIEAEIENMDEDGLEFELKSETMTLEQYDALPEFDGW